MYSVRHAQEFRALAISRLRPSRSWNATVFFAGFSELLTAQKMPGQQIFFDPERKRWKRLRRILDAVAVLSTLVVVGFTST